MIKVIVADDEVVARRRVTRLLRQDPDISVVAECAGGREAVDRIRDADPDLVFLDVQMPDLTGIEVVETIGPDRMPPVVFVTAFDRHAIKAFELNALDYILKPYDSERFEQALTRARRRMQQVDATSRASELKGLIDALVLERTRAGEADVPAQQSLDRLAVRVDGAIRIVRVDDVDWFETVGNYVRLHAGKADHMLRSTSIELERSLDPRRFARIHRRYIVNLDRVAEVQPWFAGDAVIILTNGAKLRLSRTYREAFHARLVPARG
jgi:two-component system LytT family response regulator